MSADSNPAASFKRLPARRWGVLRRASLWDAGEYLLSIGGTSFSDRYHRFYYRDIRAIIVQKAPRLGSMAGLIFLVWLIITLAVTATAPQVPTVVRWLWLPPVGLLAWMLYTNVSRSCRIVVFTAVSSQELPAVYRRSSAGKVLPLILNKIYDAQGSFGPALAGELNAMETGPLLAPIGTPATGPQALYSSSCFLLLLVASAGFAFWYRDAALTPATLNVAKVLFCIVNALEVLAGVWALMRLLNIRLLNATRLCTIAGMLLIALRAYALFLVLVQLNVKRGSLLDTMPAIRLRQWVGTVDCSASLLIAITGLISLMMTWQDDRKGSVSNL